jgi:hypothetical protein
MAKPLAACWMVSILHSLKQLALQLEAASPDPCQAHKAGHARKF